MLRYISFHTTSADGVTRFFYSYRMGFKGKTGYSLAEY
ncbi:Uncharacterized protein dnm_037490 [Desulfonema magnum]|uniref:Uncharacterized protein n=1 Tax=Desulfonema magnum TaxID=45655 RepID=A0A975BMH1_9BACT|nr:Uncharacterized protein dnm_037490 [Desulfonema magnum]